MEEKKTYDIGVINEHQKVYYESIEQNNAEYFIERFKDILEKYSNKEEIKILDIGGGGGYFSSLVYDFYGKSCKITVLDTAEYNTWKQLSDKATFVKESAENIDKIFRGNYFDIVFAKYVFHHFVKSTWSETYNGMKSIIKQIRNVIKRDGYLCIQDHFYNGFLGDTSASRTIYGFTKCKIPYLSKIFKKLGAQSAGVGVCFLSKKMWFSLFEYGGFIVESIEETKPSKLKWYYHLGLLLKTRNFGCKIIVKHGHCT
jgi:ubiquinone/menaquinone biosynthesis C-methylase UbiE